MFINSLWYLLIPTIINKYCNLYLHAFKNVGALYWVLYFEYNRENDYWLLRKYQSPDNFFAKRSAMFMIIKISPKIHFESLYKLVELVVEFPFQVLQHLDVIFFFSGHKMFQRCNTEKCLWEMDWPRSFGDTILPCPIYRNEAPSLSEYNSLRHSLFCVSTDELKENCLSGKKTTHSDSIQAFAA